MKLFDLHCDTLTVCEQTHDSLYSNPHHVDLKRGCALYNAWAQVMAVYVPDDMDGKSAWQYTTCVLDFLQQQAEQHCDDMTVIRTSHDLEETLAQRRCAVLPAVENGAALGDDWRRLQALAAYGVVYMNITWNGSNRLGHGCLSGSNDGLTDFGKKVVDKMYRVHILPDVSHINEAGFWDVANIAAGRPFLAGHSVSKSVCDHPRSLNDEQFCAVRDSGGLVGLNLCKAQLGVQSFEQLERHLDRFLSLEGERTVALGFDLDGTSVPEEWGGIAVFARFYEYLETKHYSKTLLDQIFFENSYTFFVKTLTSKAECIRIGT